MSRETAPLHARRATSADVAREAGVSRSTVSFVLNGTPGQTIPEATRRRVREAAARLRYAPSAEARTLSRGRSDVVLLYGAPQQPVTAAIGAFVEHLSAEFAGAGLTMLVHPWARRPDGDAWTAVTPVAVLAWEVAEDDVAAMRANGVGAVVSLDDAADPVARWLWGAREDAIAAAQVGRLVRAGHRRLGYAPPLDDRLADAGRRRLEALRRACTGHGLPEPVAVAPPPVGDGARPATEAVHAWRAAEPAVTGVCAHDDVAALAVLAGLRAAGLSAPRDLAVVGVGDSPAAALADPPLTMVAVDAQATARHVAAVVTGLLAGRDLPPPPEAVHVVERGSV
ncbi:substrate-binding domain-containing protein [Blastococcus sp. SYSU D00813]